MAVFPESMDRLDVKNSAAALSVIENYIRYMCERTEFAVTGVTRNVSAAGVSSAEIYILLQAQGQTLAALESALGQAQGKLTALERELPELRTAALETAQAIAALTERTQAAEGALARLQEGTAALEARVAALETREEANG